MYERLLCTIYARIIIHYNFAYSNFVRLLFGQVTVPSLDGRLVPRIVILWKGDVFYLLLPLRGKGLVKELIWCLYICCNIINFLLRVSKVFYFPYII